MTFLQACEHAKSNYAKLAKHTKLSNVKQIERLNEKIELQKTLKLPWVRSAIAILFTYQPYVFAEDMGFKISIERFASGKSPLPVYVMFMPTDNYTGEMNVNFEYMTVMHKKKYFDEFYKFMLKYLDEATAHPEKTIAELKSL